MVSPMRRHTPSVRHGGGVLLAPFRQPERRSHAVGTGHPDEGAVAIIVAICLLMLFAVGAAAIDLGSMWETKRETVIDTDAAALAGARALVGGDCSDAKQAAESTLADNLGLASVTLTTGDTFDCDATSQLVSVNHTATAQQTLSGALEVERLDVYSSSTATLVDRLGAGLRPIAACLFDDDIQNWIAGGEGSVYRFTLDNEPTNCGGAPGNWGWTCFDRDHGPYNNDAATGCNGNMGQPRIDTMLQYGYSGTVDLGASPTGVADDEDCIPDTPDIDTCNGSPGSLGNSTAPSLAALRDSGIVFSILGIYTYEPGGGGGGGGGGGANAQTTPAAFIGVRLIDFQVTGSDRWMDFELINMFDNGSSAVLTSGQPTTPSAVICGTDGGSVCPGS